jgi:hypothetical protein
MTLRPAFAFAMMKVLLLLAVCRTQPERFR